MLEKTCCFCDDEMATYMSLLNVKINLNAIYINLSLMCTLFEKVSFENSFVKNKMTDRQYTSEEGLCNMILNR